MKNQGKAGSQLGSSSPADGVVAFFATLKQPDYRPVIRGLLPEAVKQHKERKEAIDFVLRRWHSASDEEIKIISKLLKRGIQIATWSWLIVLAMGAGLTITGIRAVQVLQKIEQSTNPPPVVTVPKNQPENTNSQPSPPKPSLKPLYLVVDVDSDDVLYILSGAGVQHKIVGCIPYDGTGISIVGEGVTIGKYLWVPIQYKGTTGWVNSRYIDRYAMSSKIPSSSPTSSRYPRYRIVDVESDDTLYVHSDPGVQTKLVGCIPYDGRNVFVTGRGVNIGRSVWVPIQYEGTTGWVNSRYMTRQ